MSEMKTFKNLILGADAAKKSDNVAFTIAYYSLEIVSKHILMTKISSNISIFTKNKKNVISFVLVD